MPGSAYSHHVDLCGPRRVQLQREKRVVADRECGKRRDVADVRARRLLDAEPVGEISEHALADAGSFGGDLDLDDGHRAATTAAATSSSSASVSVRQSRSVRPSRNERDHGRRAASQRLGELLLDCAGEGRQLRERKRAATDPRDRLLHLAADELYQTLGTRANGLDRLVEHPQHGHLVARGRVERERQRPLECGERELVRSQCALEWMSP